MPRQQKSLPIPTGSYRLDDAAASCRRLVNCFPENMPQDSELDIKDQNPPMLLRRMAGIGLFANEGAGTQVRGMHWLLGVLYAVIGNGLYSVTAGGILTQVGTGIPGAGFVRMADNLNCLVVLLPNSRIMFEYTPAGGLVQDFSSTFLQFGAIDVWYVDSYMVFLAIGGREFYNDDGAAVSLTGPITFTQGGDPFPREFGTDPFVGMCVDHRMILMMGSNTSEGYFTSSAATVTGTTPFQAAPDAFITQGVHPSCAYSIALQDQSVMWVANDLTVRRRNGQTPTRISNNGIEAILNEYQTQLGGCYALCPTVQGHPMWILVIPAAGRTIAYDCLTNEWFELYSSTTKQRQWRPLCYVNFYGKQLVGDSISGQIGVLDTNIFAEFGSPMTAEWTTQSVYSNNNRIVHQRLEAVVTVGGAPTSAGLANGAQLTMQLSDDYGNTFRSREMDALGNVGNRALRAIWTGLGQSRHRVYRFLLSDPTQLFAVQQISEWIVGLN
jgi:hypothetical protein